jgi:DNA-directed RNA polymerase subunit RPC12/RpoP
MRKTKTKPKSTTPRCGLCGKTGKLTKTECCGNWICDDEDSYVLFSYARNSCYRNHRRYTLCGFHHSEGHHGDWKDCTKCRESFETELYVWYGTNEYNFQKLPNPPSFEPTKCSECGAVIKLGTESFMQRGKEYWCESCSEKRMAKLVRRTKPSSRGEPPGVG